MIPGWGEIRSWDNVGKIIFKTFQNHECGDAWISFDRTCQY